ncbi:hypothetical protein D3C78_1986470 [compost metagenome]
MLGDALNQGDDPVFHGHLLIVATEQHTCVANLLGHHFSQAGLQAMAEAPDFVVLGRQ